MNIPPSNRPVASTTVDAGRRASNRSNLAANAPPQGPVQIRDPIGLIDNYDEVDHFTADYVGDRNVAAAMKDLSTHYHDRGMAVTPELTDKVGALADAMGISYAEGMRNHHQLAQALSQDRFDGTRPAPPTTQDGFWASSAQLGGGYVVGLSIGTNPVWGSLMDTAIGLTGPGSKSLHLSENTFAGSEKGGFLAGVKNALAAVGNFFADAVGDHSKIHDAAGAIRTRFGVGKGYAYAPGAIPPGSNFTTGQVSGTLYSFGRKVSDLAQSAFKAVGDWFAPAPAAPNTLGVVEPTVDLDIDFEHAGEPSWASRAWSGIKDLASRAWQSVKDVAAVVGQAGGQNSPSILERRDFQKFGRQGQSFSDFQNQTRQNSDRITGAIASGARSTWDAVTGAASDAFDAVRDVAGGLADAARDAGRSIADAAQGAWDSVKDAFGFGDNDRDSDTKGSDRNDGGNDNRSSSSNDRSDPQSESRDSRDSGSF